MTDKNHWKTRPKWNNKRTLNQWVRIAMQNYVTEKSDVSLSIRNTIY